MTPETRALGKAWEAWDARPSNDVAVGHRIDACKVFAERFNTRWMDVTRAMQAYRRRGYSPREAAEIIEETLTVKT